MSAKGKTAKTPAAAAVEADTQQPLARALFFGALPGEAEDLDDAAAERIAAFAERALAARCPGEANVVIDDLESGDSRRRTAIAISNDDMPFLVDSVTNALSARGLSIFRLLHPILDVCRDPDGGLLEVSPADREVLPEGRRRESLIYLETSAIPQGEREPLERALLEILVDVRVSVADWRAMLKKLERAAESLGEARISVAADSVMEAKSFLNWLADDNFTLLGYASYDFKGVLDDESVQPEMEDGLGLLRDPDFELWRGVGGYESLPVALRSFMAVPDPILITKANTLSRVHRSAYFDVISVKRYDDEGKVCGEYRFVGLFTSAALARSPDHVPIMRKKVSAVREALGFDPQSHSGKALTHVLETYPRAELFLTSEERLTDMARGMLSLLDRPRPKIFTRIDPFGRFISAVVFVPREVYTGTLRERIGAMLAEAFDARLTRFDVELRAEGLARVQFFLATLPGEVPDIEERALDQRLRDLVRGWDEDLEAAMLARLGPERTDALALTYERGFSASYRDQFTGEAAAVDVERLESLASDADRQVHFYRRPPDAAHQLRIKIYRTGSIIPLSEMVPVLEAFGFKVIEEFPFDTPTETRHGWIHDFMVENPTGEAIDLDFLKEHAEGALRAVMIGERENDAFNTLVVGVQLRSEEVAWLRAYYRYLRQSVLSYGLLTVVDALAAHPVMTRALVGLFRARFGDVEGDRQSAMREARREVKRGIQGVEAIDEDRILRLYRDVIEATLRTTAFAPDAQTLAFKIESAKVPGLPAPVPYREIWVYSPRVEGIHLRGGPIARGGLRWSDRRDDFRTEVLGLVKAQMVKNAVIVPTGSKGGFYPKQLPPVSEREAWLAEGQAAYRIFINALLSLTDNVVQGETVPPQDVVCHDDPDPYLVVAADKGTATFSDIANAISVERGFWLGDAFASGGANGYDHKAMGITARGAWVSVQRHFREMGIDVQSEPVRVVGIGDMSGDVFGNGMLLSRTLKVVAAFDHRHIFIDPDPDPETSFKERERLFALPRSSWEDYDKGLISAGGGVFSRAQKSIELSDTIQAMLELPAEVGPNELMRAILKADADLLWFGGIGTYVKASGESDSAVGDRTNDDIRVEARELRVKVIGEGANLGITQPGRIAFAQLGGRVNTDFIDNSAGVDCSDNEVNIKIALQEPLRKDRLTVEARNDLLREMTDGVAALVLRDNVMQTQALSVAEAGGAATLPAFQRVIQQMEAERRLDRRVEQLPADDLLTQRAAAGAGLERPELAVLLAYAKMSLYEAIVDSDLPDDPLLEEDLFFAFPEELQTRFANEIRAHKLRREIIATKLANQIVNRGGIALAFELAEEHTVPLSRVAAAFVAARELFGFRILWRTIDAAELEPAVQITLHKRSTVGLQIHISDLIDAMPADQSPSEAVETLGDRIEGLREARETLLRTEPKAALERVRQELTAARAPADLIERLIEIEAMNGAAMIARLAWVHKSDPCDVAAAYTYLGEKLGLDWAHATASHLNPSDPWERLLAASLARDFQGMRLDLIERIAPRDENLNAAVEIWLAENEAATARLSQTIARARAAGSTTPAMLAHVASQARGILLTG